MGWLVSPRRGGALRAGCLALLLLYADASCHEALAALQLVSSSSLNALQPCLILHDHETAPPKVVTLQKPHTFIPGNGSSVQTLDLAFKASFLEVAPEVHVQVENAFLQRAALHPPGQDTAFVLAAWSVTDGARLAFQNVSVETDCATWLSYHSWVEQSNPPGVLAGGPEGSITVTHLDTASGLRLSAVTLTCARPEVSTDPAQPGRTIVTVRDQWDLYNALSLAHTLGGDELVVAVAAPNITLCSSELWAWQGGVTVRRNITVAPAQEFQGAEVILDLYDLVAVVHLDAGVYVTLRDLTLMNLAMVPGYAPMPYTALGLVSSFLWAFEYPRDLFRPTLEQLQVEDCSLVIYDAELEHMLLWAKYILGFEDEAYKIGLKAIQAGASKAGQYANITTMMAYGLNFTNVLLQSPSARAAPLSLMARSTGGYPLYALAVPRLTTTVGVWCDEDLMAALQGLQATTACSALAPNTLHVHLFANISLNGKAWPSGGYAAACNLSVVGTPGYQGGTWLDVGLAPTLVRATNAAVVSLRDLSLVNMPSLTGKYDINALNTATAPLWCFARQPSDAAAAPLVLQRCTLVLPAEEFVYVSASLSGSPARYMSQAINSSITGAKVAAGLSGGSAVSVLELKGLYGMHAGNVTLTTAAAVDMPFPALLGPDVYGGLVRAEEEGRSDNPHARLIIGLSVGLGMAIVLVGVTVAGLLLWRRRHAAAPPADQEKGGRCDGSINAASSVSIVGGSANASGDAQQRQRQAGSEGRGPSKSEAVASDTIISQRSMASTQRMAQPMRELQSLILDLADEIKDKHLVVMGAIGSGGFATVYKGLWRGIDVAVKVIEFVDRTVGDEKLQKRALTEAAICANIQHQNIVTTFSFDIRPAEPGERPGEPPSAAAALLGLGTDGHIVAAPTTGGGAARLVALEAAENAQVTSWKLYLIQEFCELGNLRVALEKRLLTLPSGQPDLPGVLCVALDIVRGLQHLHRKNIVHGDLTPSNVLLRAISTARPDAGQHPVAAAAALFVAKLADFGLSVKMAESQTAVENMRTGTPFYASPEVRKQGNLTKASDIYALGVVLWELYHGKPCYTRVRGAKAKYVYAASFPNFPPSCPAQYCTLATMCMQRDTAARPGLERIHAVLAGLLEACCYGCGSSSRTVSGLSTGASSSSGPLGVGKPPPWEALEAAHVDPAGAAAAAAVAAAQPQLLKEPPAVQPQLQRPQPAPSRAAAAQLAAHGSAAAGMVAQQQQQQQAPVHQTLQQQQQRREVVVDEGIGNAGLGGAERSEAAGAAAAAVVVACPPAAGVAGVSEAAAAPVAVRRQRQAAAVAGSSPGAVAHTDADATQNIPAGAAATAGALAAGNSGARSAAIPAALAPAQRPSPPGQVKLTAVTVGGMTARASAAAAGAPPSAVPPPSPHSSHDFKTADFEPEPGASRVFLSLED